MTPILRQFLSESRDGLQLISEKLLRLETVPADAELMGELFRLVHTLKGNSGLFEFPEMTRVLHAAEDLMAVVRNGDLAYSQALADCLFDAMDFVSMLLDEIEATGSSSPKHAAASARLAEALRALMPAPDDPAGSAGSSSSSAGAAQSTPRAAVPLQLDAVPAALRRAWSERDGSAVALWWIRYAPEPDCFFKGEDPFYQARQTPQLLWQRVTAVEAWPPLAQLDAYRCVLCFEMVSDASPEALQEHFRYVPEQIALVALTSAMLAAAGPAMAGAPGPLGAGAGTGGAIAEALISTQLMILGLSDKVPWLHGRLRAVAATLGGCYRSAGRDALLPSLEAALAAALEQSSAAPLVTWLGQQSLPIAPPVTASAPPMIAPAAVPALGESEHKSARRAEDASGANRTLKVDQDKIDRLMNLIGEMVVAKNGLPYLAARAETVFGVRELAREIKSQYAVINRVAEEMQDAIMQVRMLPVSFVFQRFPRLVRDLSRKLGKEVNLILEGEDTEADKNIIEALADPLIHIVRNSLDHGIELPEVRRAAGKNPAGRLLIHAAQESDRVVIDISDDGKGIDPAIIKRKAYEKGLIDEAVLERISDQDAINLVFAAGFSTAEAVSDLSGRGVGMDVVRTAVERVNGTVSLESQPGLGTRLRLSLPLSMAVTNVMTIESDHQVFGVPMDMVVETVRVRRSTIHTIKNQQTTVLRGRIVPLRSLNELLAANTPQQANADDEFATLVVRMQGEHIGIVVDEFREVVDIILKPMGGILGGLPGYAGSALLGDGSVLMVLNPKELL